MVPFHDRIRIDGGGTLRMNVTVFWIGRDSFFAQMLSGLREMLCGRTTNVMNPSEFLLLGGFGRWL